MFIHNYFITIKLYFFYITNNILKFAHKYSKCTGMWIIIITIIRLSLLYIS